ncbi:F-box protein At1g52495 [Linum grandiflorum]
MKVYRSRVSKWMARRRKRINDDDEQQIQKKKMKTTTTTQSKSIDLISLTSLIADDEDLVSQILSWLPVKSLMKFKCVSKAWKSIIEKDAHFINLHITCSESRSPGFLIMAARPLPRLSGDERGKYDMCFFPADSHLNVHGVKRIQSSVTCLGPVRGLVCLVDRGAVQIFNVGTGEVTPWLMPEMVKHYSRLDLALPAPSRCPRFFFGFDPSSRKHKVLCMRGAFKPHGATSHYEVLTLGEDDSRWRIIDDEPPYQLSTDMVAYANGSTYSLVRTKWFESVGSYRVMKTGSEFLVAFDFGSEKFRKIPIPTFTRLEEEEVDTTECSKKEKVVDATFNGHKQVSLLFRRSLSLCLYSDLEDTIKAKKVVLGF